MVELTLDRREVHLVILDYSIGTTHILPMPDELLFNENTEAIENWILNEFSLSYSNIHWMIAKSIKITL